MNNIHNIYRPVTMTGHYEANYIGNQFYASEELVKKNLKKYVDEHTKAGWKAEKYGLHTWKAVYFNNGGSKAATLTVTLTYKNVIGKNEYTYKKHLGFVIFEMITD